MTQSVDEIRPYDPNEGAIDGIGYSKSWPIVPHATSVESYVANVMQQAPGSLEQFVKGMVGELRKGTQLPPSMQSFATISMMPEQHSGGVVQVPGIPPEALRKIVRENVAPQMIINLRVADIQRYAQPSFHIWKPGWRVELRQSIKTPSAAELKDIEDAQCFLLNCNSEYGWDARQRDQAQLKGFATFLSELVRDTLTYDGMAIWTDRDLRDRVKAFKVLSTFNIRLTTKEGYKGDKNIFAVAVDEAGTIIAEFTRDELIFATRNPRADADIGGYGYSEIEMAIRSIQGTQNALDAAVDKMNRNAVPNGMLLATGMFTQRQLDVLTRIWSNLRKGITKEWALPIIPLPKEGKIELLDFTKLNGEDMRNQDFFNLLAGVLCSMYKFPVSRLGYRSSGAGPDSKPDDQASGPSLVDEYDPGLAPLLQSIESIINEYILWSRWPHLIFVFNAKTPKEDARAYEFRANAMTWGERRAAADMQALDTLLKGASAEEKQIARIMSMAPTDPNLAGIFQNLVSALFGRKKEEGPESEFTSKKDPAKSLEHGHQSGVMRDSKTESAKADLPLT